VAIFFTRPIAAIFMVASVLFFAMPGLQALAKRWRAAEQSRPSLQR
jgi:TctA family transporter